jgi:hypothetical protein
VSFEFESAPKWTKEYDLTIVPAQQGFYALTFCYGDNDTLYSIEKNPVIAWALSHRRGRNGSVSAVVEPICLEQSPDNAPILEPTGKVTKQEDQSWDSFDEYEKYVRENWEKVGRIKQV